eukprot:s745_g13.t1
MQESKKHQDPFIIQLDGLTVEDVVARNEELKSHYFSEWTRIRGLNQQCDMITLSFPVFFARKMRQAGWRLRKASPEMPSLWLPENLSLFSATGSQEITDDEILNPGRFARSSAVVARRRIGDHEHGPGLEH